MWNQVGGEEADPQSMSREISASVREGNDPLPHTPQSWLHFKYTDVSNVNKVMRSKKLAGDGVRAVAGEGVRATFAGCSGSVSSLASSDAWEGARKGKPSDLFLHLLPTMHRKRSTKRQPLILLHGLPTTHMKW